jgi:hypothetical protein
VKSALLFLQEFKKDAVRQKGFDNYTERCISCLDKCSRELTRLQRVIMKIRRREARKQKGVKLKKSGKDEAVVTRPAEQTHFHARIRQHVKHPDSALLGIHQLWSAFAGEIPPLSLMLTKGRLWRESRAHI